MSNTNPYTEREIKMLMEHINDKFESVNKKLDDIKIQTKITNGRVSKLELWRAGIVAVLSVLIFVLGLVAPKIIENMVVRIIQ
jgi:hypothetical protein